VPILKLWLVLLLSVSFLTVSLACGNSSGTFARTGQSSTVATISLQEALASGKPTLAEFGSNSCIPCKQMKPILAELAILYKGKLNIVIIEVYEETKLTQQYGIMAIPTQIVFDKNGKELGRHIGFWAKEDIISTLKKIGVE